MKGKYRSLLFLDFMHLSAATVMSVPTPIEAYDAQMLDFSSDPDVPMNITGSAEFFTETLMDHDGHLAASPFGEHLSVEVDMEEYVGDNAEYEMADETAEFHRPHGDELLDIEVYDASHAPSPLVPHHPLQPSDDVPFDSEHLSSTSPVFSEHATLPELRTDTESEVHPDHQVADTPLVEPSTSVEDISSEAVASESPHPVLAPDESVPPTSEFHEQQGDSARTVEQLSETPTPANTGKEVESNTASVAEEHHDGSEVAQHETAESAAPATAAYESGPAQDDKTGDHVPEPAVEKEVVDPLHISDGVYIDPPPTVLLSIPDPSEIGFTLFNASHTEGDTTGASHDGQRAFSLLFEDRPTLYYEPLSSVFEALRQDEILLSRVPHSFEGELVLDAYDLQLAVSEDNVHSREISLHDLNILHDGSDFVGPLRLLLRAIVPRFIIRYYALQEQIQRLNVVDSIEGEHEEVHHEHDDTGEEQPQSRQEEAAKLPTTHAAVSSEGVEKTEGRTQEPLSPAEQTGETHEEESYEEDDTYGAQDEAAHALEEEGDYEGTNAGDEDESARHDNLDADQIHKTVAEDTDASATVTGQESKIGGEQTEYLDYVQQAEYDERYGEDLPERAEGALDVQYGEPAHYQSEGEQDMSAAADETRAILPGSDEGEEDKSVDTPTPVRTVLEPELDEHVDNNTTNELVPPEHEYVVPGSEELATSESISGVIHVQTSGNQDANTTQTKVTSEIDESGSKFVSLLEHEADAELGRALSTQQSGQESSVEIALQHDETWDEWDDEDAEGEDEEGWLDPDAVSNESSVTLSSKASSKRSYEEVDLDEEVNVEEPRSSPGSKRPRVQ